MLKRKYAVLIALVLVVAMVFAACDTGTTTAPPPVAPTAPDAGGGNAGVADPGPIALEDAELVVVMPSAEHGWIAAVNYFAEAKGRELGIAGYRVLTSSNVAEQAGQLDELISQNVDAIVLFPHSDELSFPAQRVVDAGIPLFIFNRNVHADFVLRLLGSNLLIGGESARVIAEGIGGSGVVAYMQVPSVGSTSVERIDAFNDVMAQFPDIEVVTMTATGISIEEGLRITTDMLTANPHVDAIFTIDDSLSIGALQAVREAGRSDVQFINGSGGSQVYFQMIADTDDIFLLTATFAADMIVDTIELAVEYLEGRRDFSELFEPDFGQDNVIIIPPTIVDRYNVDQFFAPGSPW